jgi:serine/threonine protein kinase
MIEKLHIPININKNLTIDDFNIIETNGTNKWGNTCKVIHIKTDHVYSANIINKNDWTPNHTAIIQNQLQNYIDVSETENVNGIKALFECDQFVFIFCEFNEINLAFLYGNRMYWNEIDFEQKMEVFMRIVCAVHACHESGVIHGDVRMENIEIRSDSSACLINFSNSYLVHHSTVEWNNAVALDPPPPETVASPPIISTALDCWGLGLLLYELLVDLTKFNVLLANSSDFHFDLLPDEIRVIGRGLLRHDHSNRWNTNKVLKYLSKIGF